MTSGPDNGGAAPRPRRPVVSSEVLVAHLARNPAIRPDGFVVESPHAGGHNAPPRGRPVLDERGQPVFGARDDADVEKVAAVGLPFWLAGGRGTPEALRAQGDIARDAGRPTLAENFERAAELVDVPQETVMRIYEPLRPGRAKSKEQLLDAARLLRDGHGAERMAAFVEEAAEVYEARGLFTFRF